MDSYEFLKQQKDEIIQQQVEKAAEIIYDWLHEQQVTHRKAWSERSAEDQRQYLKVAKKVVDVLR